jgi:hypothetical protein
MKKWLLGIAFAFVIAGGGLFVAASILATRVEPYIREQAVQYLRRRFDGEVELRGLRVRVPPGLPVLLLFTGGRGVVAEVEGSNLSLRHRGRTDVPPMFALKRFRFKVDIGKLWATPKIVNSVTLDELEISIPPKGERMRQKAETAAENPAAGVAIEEVLVRNARLTILPRDKTKVPMSFDIHFLRLESAGKDVAMKYTAVLTNPRPPGEIHSEGVFGPWVVGEPGDTPLGGEYLFEKADLSVFTGIAGILRSTGKFKGTLSAVTARGEATVPDFRLKMSGNPLPLSTRFEVLVDGTNGNTELKPVVATLGSTHFTTSGFVVKHDGDERKTISLRASMRAGNVRDLLSLALKGPPIMEGTIRMDTKIGIPPLSGKVREKLLLDGSFQVTGGKFLQSRIQEKVDELSHRGQGKPKGQAVDEAVHRMSGKFKLADESLAFRTLAFSIPGADINIGGVFDMDADKLDFHGALMLDAKLSQTQSGWKRWVLKPVDPFFSKRGAGTFLHIKVVGSSKDPQFGLDRGGTSPAEEAEKAAVRR